MAIDVVMPQMGESILEGTLTKWLKKAGDRVQRDESLFEVSTDKVDSEIPSPADGVLSELLVPEGETVKVGTIVAKIVEHPADAAEPVPAGQSLPESVAEKEAGTEEAAQRVVPHDEAMPEPVAQPAIEQEMIPEIQQAVGASGNAAAGVEEPPADVAGAVDTAGPVVSQRPAAGEQGFIHTSPLVRRIAREYGVELSDIRGTGLSGRITRNDLHKYLEEQGKLKRASAPAVARAVSAGPAAAESARAREAAPAPPVLETPQASGDIEIVAMTTMRRAIADHMIASRRISAHVQTVFEVDMTAIVRLREKHKDEFETREGIKLTYTPFFAKALVDVVGDFPILNSSVAEDKIIFKKAVNLGIAVALETGLIVPVVKDAHLKSFTALARAIRDVAGRARARKLKPEEVQNGTITITNPGIYGSLFGTPIINQPQVAILGAGSLQKRAVVINDAIAIRTMAYLVLSFDHRVIDGAVADQAMAALKMRLESWNQRLDQGS
jgi:2-oxoglutarate dehydrogenase E2 component (dihydrolipoamide succinyltransferase)